MAQILSVVDKYIENLKSKRISDYSLPELAEIIDIVYTLYENNKDKLDKKKLDGVYIRLAAHYNERVGRKSFKTTLKLEEDGEAKKI